MGSQSSKVYQMKPTSVMFVPRTESSKLVTMLQVNKNQPLTAMGYRGLQYRVVVVELN